MSRLIRWYNKPGDITIEFWEKAIQFHGTFQGLKIAKSFKPSQKKKKKDMIYMGIIYTSFLSRNLLCKNVYTMSSFIMNMSDMLLNGILSDSHSSSSSLSSLMSRAAKKSMSLGLLAFLKWFDYPRWLTGRYYKTDPRVRDLLFLIQWLLCENCFPAIRVLRPT